jgi:RNA polymerase sigma factor (sigma-70 family)
MVPHRSNVASDELLAQLGWVRALAGSLVHDPHAADDVLQRVCLLALEKPPARVTHGAGLRAWLASATRTLAAHSARSASRRRRREHVFARPEALPSTADTVERRERLTRLVEAVTSLQEPDFSTIVERYFDGLTTAEMVARHGLTEAAVRKRITRAKQRLRARLERDPDFERRRRLGSLRSVLAWPLLLKHAWAGSATHESGALIMAKSVGSAAVAKAAVVAVVLTGVSLTAWQMLSGSAEPESATAVLAQGDVPAPATPHAPPRFELDVPPRLLVADTAPATEPDETVPAPEEPESALAVTGDSLAALLDDATASFVTDSPDLLRFNAALFALAQAAAVVPESVATDPKDGSVSGWLAIDGSEMKAQFTISAEGRFDVRLESGISGAALPPFTRRSVALSLTDDHGVPAGVGSVVQFQPDTSPAGFARLIQSLSDDGESHVGWGLAVGAAGTVGRPLSMRLSEDGQGVRVGHTENLAPLDAPWAGDTAAYNAWLKVLQGYAP